MTDVRVLLTFDDGPAAGAPDPTHNTTLRLIDRLAQVPAPNPVCAAFFIQTDWKWGLGSPNATSAARHAHDAGHSVQIHSGALTPHPSHILRSSQGADVNPLGVGGGQCGLDSDMIRAKKRIEDELGESPRFVRPTYGAFDALVLAVYARNQLIGTLWNVKTQDFAVEPSAVKDVLSADIVQRLHDGSRDLVILFHDPIDATVDNILDYVDRIKATVSAAGFSPVFPSSRAEALAVLDAQGPLRSVQWGPGITRALPDEVVLQLDRLHHGVLDWNDLDLPDHLVLSRNSEWEAYQKSGLLEWDFER